MKDRTKLALSIAFAELLRDKSIEKITIQNIVDKSGYNRQTFYYHFQDIFDLMAWNIENILKAAEKRVQPQEDMEDVMRRVFKSLRQYRIQIIHAYNPDQRREYEKLFEPWLRENFRTSIGELEGADQISKEKIDFMIDSYTWLSLGLIFQWLEDGMPKKTEKKLHYYYVLFDTSVTAALKRFVEEEKSGDWEFDDEDQLIELSSDWYDDVD